MLLLGDLQFDLPILIDIKIINRPHEVYFEKEEGIAR